MTTAQDWQTQSQRARDILEASIPKQWLAPPEKLPPPEQLAVYDFAKTSGLLSDKELEITEKSATELVTDMAAGALTAEEVVIAFLKRSVLGHQVVCI